MIYNNLPRELQLIVEEYLIYDLRRQKLNITRYYFAFKKWYEKNKYFSILEKYNANMLFIYNCDKGNNKLVKYYDKYKISSHNRQFGALFAYINNNTELINYLNIKLEDVNEKCKSYIVLDALENRNIKTIEYLIKNKCKFKLPLNKINEFYNYILSKSLIYYNKNHYDKLKINDDRNYLKDIAIRLNKDINNIYCDNIINYFKVNSYYIKNDLKYFSNITNKFYLLQKYFGDYYYKNVDIIDSLLNIFNKFKIPIPQEYDKLSLCNILIVYALTTDDKDLYNEIIKLNFVKDPLYVIIECLKQNNVKYLNKLVEFDIKNKELINMIIFKYNLNIAFN